MRKSELVGWKRTSAQCLCKCCLAGIEPRLWQQSVSLPKGCYAACDVRGQKHPPGPILMVCDKSLAHLWPAPVCLSLVRGCRALGSCAVAFWWFLIQFLFIVCRSIPLCELTHVKSLSFFRIVCRSIPLSLLPFPRELIMSSRSLAFVSFVARFPCLCCPSLAS